jgi:hypothetical protein
MGERKRWKCDLGEILGVKSAEEVGGQLAIAAPVRGGL